MSKYKKLRLNSLREFVCLGLILMGSTGCVSGPTLQEGVHSTDELSAIGEIESFLACCEAERAENMSQATLGLLSINPDFPAEARDGGEEGVSYRSILSGSPAGTALLGELEAILDIGESIHPTLTRSQLILLRSAVYLGTKGGDDIESAYTYARALELAGDFSLRQSGSEYRSRETLFVLPFYTLANGIASRHVAEEGDRFTRLRESTAAKIEASFGISAESTEYYFPENYAPITEGSLKRRIAIDRGRIASSRGDRLRGMNSIYVFSLAYNFAAIIVLDLNGDSKVSFEELLAVGSDQLRVFEGWVALLDLSDTTGEVYHENLLAIRATAVEPTEDPNYAAVSLDLRRDYINPIKGELVQRTGELFPGLNGMPPRLRGRVAMLGAW